MATYKIHPGIGIARLGNSDTEFYLAPETPAGLPIECDNNGNPRFGSDGITPVLVTTFRDAQGRIKRQAARFQVFVYDEQSLEGRPLKIGDHIEGGGNGGALTEIHWQVYVANKKACWYEFDATLGEHGYPPAHPRRNGDVSDRSRLIIDPGPRTVNSKKRPALFDRSGEGATPRRFRRRCHRIRSNGGNPRRPRTNPELALWFSASQLFGRSTTSTNMRKTAVATTTRR